jgi:hypothetical protein
MFYYQRRVVARDTVPAEGGTSARFVRILLTWN